VALGPACAFWRGNPDRLFWPYFAPGHSCRPPKHAAKTTAAEKVTAKKATPIAIVMGPPGHNPTIGTPSACRCKTPRGKCEPIHRHRDALRERRRFRRRRPRSRRHGTPESVHRGAGPRLSAGPQSLAADRREKAMPFDPIHESDPVTVRQRGRV